MLSTRDTGHDAKVEITRDMLQRMLLEFDNLADQHGILNLELRGNGLFVKDPVTGSYEVIGLARMSGAMNHLR